MRTLILLMVTMIPFSQGFSNPFDKLRPCETRVFWHNMTDPINKLISGIGETKALKDGLQWSPHVFYSTPLILNKVMPVVLQIIRSLEKISPDLRLMLSLQFTLQNRFAWARLEDLFYDLQSNLTHLERQLVKKHLSSVVMDWQLEWYNSCTYGKGYDFMSIGNQPNQIQVNLQTYSFAKYVKNWLNLHIGSNNISVGIIYSKTQTMCPFFFQFIWDQLSEADYHVLGVNFEYPEGLILSPSKFYASIEAVLDAPRKVAKAYNVSKVPILVTINEGGTTTKKFMWRTADEFIPVLRSLTYLKDLSIAFLEKLYAQKYRQLFTNLLMSLPEVNNTDVIFGATPSALQTFANAEESSKLIQWQYATPYLNTSESTDDDCGVIEWVKRAKQRHHTIALSVDSWRYLTRFKHEIELGHSECEDLVADIPNPGNLTNVILFFRGDILKMWSLIEPSVKKLLSSYETLYGLTIANLMFPAENLQQRDLSNFLQSPFVKGSPFNIGCAVSFGSVLRQWKDIRQFENKTRSAINVFREVFPSLCEPIFETLTLMMWSLEDDSDYLRDFPGAFNDIFFLREVFTREFPGKQVIINPKIPNVLRNVLVELHEAHVLGQMDVI